LFKVEQAAEDSWTLELFEEIRTQDEALYRAAEAKIGREMEMNERGSK
jgi:hypothetical protein